MSYDPKPRTLIMRGVDALSRREYSRSELRRKLLRSCGEEESADDVEEVLNTLESKGYLSNARYAQSRVRTRAARYGNRRLAGELAMMGIDSETISESLEQAGDEFERARTLWQRKFGKPPADRRERDRQVRYLTSRGFDFDVVSKLVSADEQDA